MAAVKGAKTPPPTSLQNSSSSGGGRGSLGWDHWTNGSSTHRGLRVINPNILLTNDRSPQTPRCNSNKLAVYSDVNKCNLAIDNKEKHCDSADSATMTLRSRTSWSRESSSYRRSGSVFSFCSFVFGCLLTLLFSMTRSYSTAFTGLLLLLSLGLDHRIHGANATGM